jgi:hypothetical protein
MSKLLHVFGPQCWHDSSWIVGNREALTALRDAIDRVLSSPDTGVGVEVFAADGEGSQCFVYHHELSDRSAVPYTGDDARENRPDAVWPWQEALKLPPYDEPRENQVTMHDSPAHVHQFTFLRQERRNVGYDRNPVWLVEDVFFCAACLEYRRVAVAKETPANDGGRPYIERLK